MSDVDQLELIDATDGEAHLFGRDILLTYHGGSASMRALLGWSQRKGAVRVQTTAGTVTCLVKPQVVGSPTRFHLVNVLQ